MERPLWLPRERRTVRGTKVTQSRIVEAIDRRQPETLAALADRLDVTEDYLSRQVRELKGAGVVTKAYVVDRERVYDAAPPLADADGSEDADGGPPRAGFVDSLRAFEQITTDIYETASARVSGDASASAHEELVTVASRRHRTLLADLKSYCLTSQWPGNRVAADVARIAARLEQVGHQSSLVAETLTDDLVDHAVMTGVFREDVEAAFEAGAQVGGAVRAILFDADLDRLAGIEETWVEANRTVDELLDRVLVQEAADYGALTTAIRALERAVWAWVRAGHLAATLHSGLEPESPVRR